eukprot:3355956-Karenia_brevis.AAC.1
MQHLWTEKNQECFSDSQRRHRWDQPLQCESCVAAPKEPLFKCSICETDKTRNDFRPAQLRHRGREMRC